MEPATPASPNTFEWQKREIQLENEWTFFFELGQPKGMTKEAYEDNMKILGSFNTVQVFHATVRFRRHARIRSFHAVERDW